MRNRATAIRMVIGTWLILAVGGDIGLALAPMPPGQASNVASDESLVITLLAMVAWPVFSAVLAALYFTLVVNHRTPPQREVQPQRLRGNTRVQTIWIATTFVLVLSLAVYGTVALAQDQPGGGISTVVGGAPAVRVTGSATRGAGDRTAVVVHLPLPERTVESRPRNSSFR